MSSLSKANNILQRLAGATLSAIASACLAFAQESPPASYQNPVVAGDFADPSIIRVGETYYATGTSSEWAPYFPLYTSLDLVNWKQIGHVFDKMPEWASSSFWAPELYHHKGVFHVYYSARRKTDNVSVIGVATSEDPSKGFTDRGIIREWGSEAIDGFVFRDNDGKLYFSWKAYGLDQHRPIALMACEMTDDALGFKGEPFELRQADGKPISAEGQVMTRRGDWYYLIYSAKGCCGRGCDYQLEVARAKDLKGPWERSPLNPLLAGGDGWICPGHGTMVTLPDGRDFFLYHAYHAKDNVFTGRQGLLDELIWPEDGWPAFASGPSPSVTAPMPLPEETAAVAGSRDFVDSFDGPALSPEWQWDFNHPPKANIADGRLRLEISETHAFLGVRVNQGDYTFTATIDPRGSAQEGIAAYGDAKNSLGISRPPIAPACPARTIPHTAGSAAP
jgi:xylan 1,4-beta-xylosidase